MTRDSSFAARTAPGMWTCRHCGALNEHNDASCDSCAEEEREHVANRLRIAQQFHARVFGPQSAREKLSFSVVQDGTHNDMPLWTIYRNGKPMQGPYETESAANAAVLSLCASR
jgi:hypothetical protein